MFRFYDDLTRAVMIWNRWQRSSYISFILTVSPASFNFYLIGQLNDEKKMVWTFTLCPKTAPIQKKKKKKKKKKKILGAAYCSCLYVARRKCNRLPTGNLPFRAAYFLYGVGSSQTITKKDPELPTVPFLLSHLSLATELPTTAS